MDFLEDIDMDSSTFTEALVLAIVLVLVVVLMVVLCCHLKKRTDERRKREELVEEAGSFFSFHEALPHCGTSEPGPLAAFYKSTVFSLSGSKMYPGQPYTALPQTPFQSTPVSGGLVGEKPVLLDPGQMVSTPIYPPSYFSSVSYDPSEPHKATAQSQSSPVR